MLKNVMFIYCVHIQLSSRPPSHDPAATVDLPVRGVVHPTYSGLYPGWGSVGKNKARVQKKKWRFIYFNQGPKINKSIGPINTN